MNPKFAKYCLEKCDWKINNQVEIPKKCVICIAPHTSNWDFILGNLFKSALSLNIPFFMKKEWFRFPLGRFMRSLGGIPIDRSKTTSITDDIAAEFAKHDSFYVAVTPEGTRSFTRQWRRGFYFIAQKAEVPIVLGYIDYGKKELGCGALFEPTGDVEADMLAIKQFYANVQAKFPEKFGY